MNCWWLSDCGQYIAHIWSKDGRGSSLKIDVMSTTGPECWLGGRYQPTGWHDKDRRYTHAEFAHMVTSWSNGYPHGFSLGFSDLDQSVRLLNMKGNAVLKSYTARFSRPIKLRAKAKKGGAK
jgi:hypothetical protein